MVGLLFYTYPLWGCHLLHFLFTFLLYFHRENLEIRRCHCQVKWEIWNSTLSELFCWHWWQGLNFTYHTCMFKMWCLKIYHIHYINILLMLCYFCFCYFASLTSRQALVSCPEITTPAMVHMRRFALKTVKLGMMQVSY